jgi:two-component sensor histidine kinase
MTCNLKPIYKQIISLLLVILCHQDVTKALNKSDTLSLKEFNHFDSEKEKINWLYSKEIPNISEFVIKYPKAYDTLFKSIKGGKNEALKFQLNCIEGYLYYHHNKYQKAIPILLNVLSESKYITQEDSVNILVKLKNCFGRLLNYPKVFEMHKVLTEISQRNPKIKLKDLGLPLSSVYINMGLVSQGIKYLKAEYNNNPNRKIDQYAEVNFYNNLGVVWNKSNNPDSAIYYFKKAEILIENFLKHDSTNLFIKFFEGLIAGNIGQALMAKNKYNEAIPLLKKDITSSIQYGNLLNAAISYNELAHCYFKGKHYKNAAQYLDSSYFFLCEVDAPSEKLRNLKLRAELFSLNGSDKKAVIAYKAYIDLKDSIAANDKELLMLNQQIVHQTNELQERIAQQEKKMVANMLNEEKRNNQRVLLFVLLFLMLAIIVFGYFLYIKSKKREQVLYEKNEEITLKSDMLIDALKEKELLIKEVHHRVKNNMQIIVSLLKLQSEKINDKNLEVYFSEARNRISSMALIHEFLYKKDKMDFMQMDEYIKQLILEIQISYAQPNHIIEIHTDLDDIQLDFDTSIPLGLIINELVTNAYKHAFPNGVGNIWVSFKQLNEKFILRVKDNGIGAPENFETKIENSLGMELIQLLSNQIDAKLKITHQPGFEAELTFIA